MQDLKDVIIKLTLCVELLMNRSGMHCIIRFCKEIYAIQNLGVAYFFKFKKTEIRVLF